MATAPSERVDGGRVRSVVTSPLPCLIPSVSSARGGLGDDLGGGVQ